MGRAHEGGAGRGSVPVVVTAAQPQVVVVVRAHGEGGEGGWVLVVVKALGVVTAHEEVVRVHEVEEGRVGGGWMLCVGRMTARQQVAGSTGEGMGRTCVHQLASVAWYE
jgi:hypothetical protein